MTTAISKLWPNYERYTWKGASVYCPGDTRPWRGGGHTDIHTHRLQCCVKSAKQQRKEFNNTWKFCTSKKSTLFQNNNCKMKMEHEKDMPLFCVNTSIKGWLLVWWWMFIFSYLDWHRDIQTDRPTDRQTDRPTTILLELLRTAKKYIHFFVTCEAWHMTCDTWHVPCDMWHVTRDAWHMKCEMLHVVGGEHSLKNFAP